MPSKLNRSLLKTSLWIDGIATIGIVGLALVIDPGSLVRPMLQWLAVILGVMLLFGTVILVATRGDDAKAEAKLRRRDELDRAVRTNTK
jgi:hypothetical protein